MTPEEHARRIEVERARDAATIVVKLDDDERKRTGVQSYFFYKRRDQIIELFVNTDERWPRFNRMSDEWLEINPQDGRLGPILVLDSRLVAMEQDGVSRQRYLMQEKDQAHFLSIPTSFLVQE